MARYTDTTPPQVPQHSVKSQCIEQTRLYEVITPLLGGGSKVHTVDSETTVRVSQIRGMLRFWWRATRGGQYDTIAKLKRAESSIWGGSIGKEMVPSAVCISMNIENAGNECISDSDISPTGSSEKLSSQKSKYSYVLFPLREKTEVKLRKNVVFRLNVIYPESLSQEVEAAFWAWELFGGIGARTRRGLGAISLKEVDGKKRPLHTTVELQQHIALHAATFIDDTYAIEGVPLLKKNIQIGSYEVMKASVGFTAHDKSAISVFGKLIARYRSYRQTRHTSEGGSAGQGESIWPDPNALRYISGVALRSKNFYATTHHIPRAQLGLPIISTFPNAKFDNRTRKVTFTIQNAMNRHASPLIFRPHVVEGGYVGIILILGNTRIDYPLDITSDGPFLDRSGTQLSPIGEAKIMNPQNEPHGPTNTSDVLAGVFAYMKNA